MKNPKLMKGSSVTVSWLECSITDAENAKARKADIATLKDALSVLKRLVSEGNK